MPKAKSKIEALDLESMSMLRLSRLANSAEDDDVREAAADEIIRRKDHYEDRDQRSEDD